MQKKFEMNRHAKWNLRNNQPLKKGDDMDKLMEKLKTLEKDALETKAELKVTKDLLESARAEIIELKTVLATKEVLNNENKAAPQPKENKEKLQRKENKAEKQKIEQPAEVNDIPPKVDLHNAYGKLPYDSLVELESFADELKVVEFYDHIVSDIFFFSGATAFNINLCFPSKTVFRVLEVTESQSGLLLF